MRKFSRKVGINILKFGSQNSTLYSALQESQFNQSLKNTIISLKKVASLNNIVSLSSNQIGHSENVFVSLKKHFLKPGKWRNYNQKQESYEAIINPKIISNTDLMLYDYEQCPSFEGIKFKVLSPIGLKIKYNQQNQFETKQIQLSGFQCRIWDHQIRHLQGTLCIDWEVSKGQLELTKQFKGDIQNQNQLNFLKQYALKFKKQNLQNLQSKINNQNMKFDYNLLSKIKQQK